MGRPAPRIKSGGRLFEARSFRTAPQDEAASSSPQDSRRWRPEYCGANLAHANRRGIFGRCLPFSPVHRYVTGENVSA